MLAGIWGGKGQGKTFQTELIFRALGVEPIIMSAGEMESERAGRVPPYRWFFNRFAYLFLNCNFLVKLIGFFICIGEPGKLIRERYRTASQVVQNQVRHCITFTAIHLHFFNFTTSKFSGF